MISPCYSIYMNGSGGSNRGFASYEELKEIAAEADDRFDNSERETMEFPPDTAAKVGDIISDTREILTCPPPPMLDGDPEASVKYFQQLDDETSGEANRIAHCWKLLQQVRLALSNREFKLEKSLLRSIFLMPFPDTTGQVTRIKLLAFDHAENSLPLDEIASELLALTSYKDNDTRNNLSREGRLNLIKALTEYYDDLVIKPFGRPLEDQSAVNLEVNYIGIIETINKLDFELVAQGDSLPRFRVGRDLIVITPELVAFFKQKFTKYFLDKHRESKDRKPLVAHGQVVRSGVLPLNSNSVKNPDLRKNLSTEKESKIIEVDYVIRKLHSISKDILMKVSPSGSVLDTLRALVMVEELTKTETIKIDEYIELFELNDETEAISLARRVANARVEINSMNLPIELTVSLLSEFLTKDASTINTDLWEKIFNVV